MSTIRGKILVGLIGCVCLLLVCCVVGVLFIPQPPVVNPAARQTATAAAAAMALATSAPAATARPEATETAATLAVPTEVATIAPMNTLEPAMAPTDAPAPTDMPDPATTASVAPQPAAATGGGHSFNGDKVDPPWWPCQQGQIKANQNSGIFHVPGGRDYAKTYQHVQCFDTTAAAAAAGYRQAKR
jgi:micrococcal nuclease